MTVSQQKKALGSEIILTLVADQDETLLNEILRQLWIAVFLFEKRFSRFLPESELSVFNCGAGIKRLVSPEFKAILQAAKRMSAATEGLYNPFILPALQKAGYNRSFMSKHSEDVHDDHSGKQVVTIEKLEIGDDWARIPYGTAIDLGGCGKGYLADELAAMVIAHNLQGFWFWLGGDIIVGGSDGQSKPWRIDIQHNTESPSKNAGYIEIPKDTTLAVATSGVGFRQGIKDGKRWHHIIDPRTRQPAETDVLEATVCARRALDADVYASCAIITGSQAAIPFLKKRSVENALLKLSHSARQTSIKKFGPLIHTYRQT